MRADIGRDAIAEESGEDHPVGMVGHAEDASLSARLRRSERHKPPTILTKRIVVLASRFTARRFEPWFEQDEVKSFGVGSKTNGTTLLDEKAPDICSRNIPPPDLVDGLDLTQGQAWLHLSP
jgi:hypothetical protein